MRTVSEQDKALMETLRKLFNDAKSKAAEDQSKAARSLIIPTTICFVDYYDQDRMKPLQKIANKVSQIDKYWISFGKKYIVTHPALFLCRIKF